MDVLLIIGRVLFSLIFLGSGVAGHLLQADGTAGYAQMRGIPAAKALTQISGVLIVAGGIGVIFGIWIDLAALGLAVYVLIAAFWIHHFWTDEDQMTQQIEMTNFMKNLALAGAGIIIFTVAASGADLGPTVTDPLFSL